MDERAFGEWSKRVAQAGTRRGTVRVLAAGLVTAVSATLGGGDATEAAFGYCSLQGAQCSQDKKCCSGKCQSDGTCSCMKKGGPCFNKIGANCCSGKCKKGRCK